MNDETNTQANSNDPVPSPDSNQATTNVPLGSSGRKIILPSEALTQEMQSQQQQPATQPLVPISQSPQSETVQPTIQESPSSIYPMPPTNQMQPGMSASQLGLNEPKDKFRDLNPKKLIIKGLVALVIIAGIFAALVFTNIIALSEFKNIGYTNSKDTHFTLDFYTKHSSKQLGSGNTQLISKVSKDGKFPATLSISTTDEMSAYNRVKDCASFTKVFEVQNNNLNQKISVCNFGKQGQQPADSVYVAGFTKEDQVHIITIGQDYGDINLSSQSGAQESLARFGLEPYKADIERIVSSINVE